MNSVLTAHYFMANFIGHKLFPNWFSLDLKMYDSLVALRSDSLMCLMYIILYANLLKKILE